MVLKGLPDPGHVIVTHGRGLFVDAILALDSTRSVLLVASPGAVRRLDAPARIVVERWPTLEVLPHSGGSVVAEGLVAFDRVQPETILGLGGGMALDVAKVTAALSDVPRGDRRAALRARTLPMSYRRTVNLVAVPTTAGSGSEVTPWATLWEARGKTSFEHAACFPDRAVVDPDLTESLPPSLTLAGGLDATAHAIESIWGRRNNSESDVLAVAALELIGGHLQDVLTKPYPDGRSALARAATLAGLALSGCRSAGAHALSYDLTHRHGVAHGHAVGGLLPALFPAVQNAYPQRAALILGALGLRDASAFQAFVERLFPLAGVPPLSDLGLDRRAIDELIRSASRSDRLGNHPVPIDAAHLAEGLGAASR